MTDNIAGFNYDALKPQQRADVLRHAKEIHERLEKTSLAIVEIGHRLNKVRDRIGRNNFQAWLKAEFRWSKKTASAYMRASKNCGHLKCLDKFQPSALYLLARAKVTKAVISDAARVADNGETVTAERVRAICAKHGVTAKPATKPNPPAAQSPDCRTLLRRLTDYFKANTARMSSAECLTVADELLELAMQLRTAGKQSRPKKKTTNRKKTARKPQRAA